MPLQHAPRRSRLHALLLALALLLSGGCALTYDRDAPRPWVELPEDDDGQTVIIGVTLPWPG